MVILIAFLLALVPTVAILWPFIRGHRHVDPLEDETSTQAELERRWDAALVGLKSAELELGLGNLDEEAYHWLREQYMSEAASVMKAMELEEEQEAELLASIEREVEEIRRGLVGPDPESAPGGAR